MSYTKTPTRSKVSLHFLDRDNIDKLTIHYSLFESPWGSSLLAVANSMLIALFLLDETGVRNAISDLTNRFSYASTDKKADLAEQWDQKFRNGQSIDVLLIGTTFQQKVWKALTDIPKGQTRTYGEIAGMIGQPKAARAAGAAIGSNPVAVLVPCHRALPAGGGLGKYHWGKGLKKRLLQEEGVNVRERALSRPDR